MDKRIYADNSATTPVSAAALEAMLPYFTRAFGNPSATYSYGREAKKALEESRRTVARALGAQNNEIFFTSGGTEADNWAIRGACKLNEKKGRHIISTQIEHSAVLRTLELLKDQGWEATLLKPDPRGRITAEQLREALREDTVLVSIMAANNVAGTLLPIRELCAAAHQGKALFHTDAVQAAGHIPLDVRDSGVDLLSISAHKFRGPKGVGALFARLPLILPPLITGGGQEKGRRSGTENVSAVAGMAAALEEAVQNLEEHGRRVSALRDRLVLEITKIPGAQLTGDPVNRLPGLASFVFENLEGQELVMALDRQGICASSGSACSAGAADAPHVLVAMGYAPGLARGALRLSLGPGNTDADVDAILAVLPGAVEQARAKKPLSGGR
ncbi:MAG: cysteine desulfurase [Spirochaetaceae bacterium]|jgi:cysteine desulfurase|nr:cysteine desulfurase [Spirochaetaceae bacterium]